MMARRMIRWIDHLLNTMILSVCILLMLYGGYGIWDSAQIQKQADVTLYETYKPVEHSATFEELQMINTEVFGWLTVDHTMIDYPLVQGENNSKYVNTDVYGQFSLSGSLFLDVRNQKDFSDFHHVIYGHHMEKNAMFGELAQYVKEDYFNSHLSGKLFYDGTWHQLELFAFLHVDAHDSVLYDTEITTKEQKQNYFSYVKEHAIQYREISLQENDHFLAMSTCTSESTNGRHILLGRIL